MPRQKDKASVSIIGKIMTKSHPQLYADPPTLDSPAVSGSGDGTVRIWETWPWKRKVSLPVSVVQISAQGRYPATPFPYDLQNVAHFDGGHRSRVDKALSLSDQGLHKSSDPESDLTFRPRRRKRNVQILYRLSPGDDPSAH